MSELSDLVKSVESGISGSIVVGEIFNFLVNKYNENVWNSGKYMEILRYLNENKLVGQRLYDFFSIRFKENIVDMMLYLEQRTYTPSLKCFLLDHPHKWIDGTFEIKKGPSKEEIIEYFRNRCDSEEKKS